MISPWEIYWVMQLDSIGNALQLFGGGGILVAVGLTVWNGVSRMDSDAFSCLSNREVREAAWASRGKVRTQVLKFALPIFALSAFVPSTKTAAAMLVIPAIANNEAIQKEAGELYGLAKDGLRELVKPDAEPAKADK